MHAFGWSMSRNKLEKRIRKELTRKRGWITGADFLDIARMLGNFDTSVRFSGTGESRCVAMRRVSPITCKFHTVHETRLTLNGSVFHEAAVIWDDGVPKTVDRKTARVELINSPQTRAMCNAWLQHREELVRFDELLQQGQELLDKIHSSPIHCTGS